MSVPSLVVKLGGSHIGADSLSPWLRAIAASRPVLLVPGGGAFADVVRNLQSRLAFSERAAHDMALLAINQFGRLLCDLHAGLKMAADFPAIEATIKVGEIPVIAPWPMLVEEPLLSPSWDVTSDSIALWYARHYRSNLLIIKHNRPSGGLTPEELAGDGYLDRAFPRLVRSHSQLVHVAGREDLPEGCLDPRNLPGVAIRLHGFA